MDTMSDEELYAVIRSDFGFFCEMAFGELHNRAWIDAPYLVLLERIFENCHQRKIRRLILNMPPRHLKSMFASVFYPAWRLGQCPDAKIIEVSYSDELGAIFSRDVRKIMLSPWYRATFPNTIISSEKSSVGHFETLAGGRLFSTTPGGALAGIGATDIILDDVMKPQNVGSEQAREKLFTWFQSEVLNRFDNPAEGVLILVMHRLHPDDISNRLEQLEGYQTVKLPLIATETESHTDQNTGEVVFKRAPGETLNPDLFPSSEIERLKKETSQNIFLARYQQQPVAPGAGLVKVAWFPRYNELPPDMPTFQSWDIATTQSAGSYSVCTTWGYHADRFYLLDVYRKQVEFPELRKMILQLNKKFKPALVLIEAVGAGKALYSDLLHLGMTNIARCGAYENKLTRLEKCILFMSDGGILLPEHAPWLATFLNELVEFPEGKYDDQVDSLSQLIRYRAVVLDRARIKPQYIVTATTI